MEATIDRRIVLPAIFPDHQAFLFVSGLAGSARDLAALTDDGDHLFALGGVMGAATTIGLGMAVGAPDKRIVVVTGDGELHMNIGSLVTVASAAPANLTLICLDNERHGETGNQKGHTARGVSLEALARSVGFKSTRTITEEADLSSARTFIDDAVGPGFLTVKVRDTEPSAYKRLMDPAACRYRFKTAFSA